jgi:TRAP-type C4-dicarboxylate transport system substrate-binding protein
MLRVARQAATAILCLGMSALGANYVQAQAANPEVSWNLSVWGPPRAFTAGIEELSKHVESGSGGKFKIRIHYGDSLSKAVDNLDNIKLGAFAMAQICTGYHPGKNPALSVLDLPGLPLVDPDVHSRVHDVVYKHPAVVEEFKRWGAIPFMSVIQPQSELMGVGNPPMKMEDFKGMRVRALGGTGDALKNLGAVPTSVAAPEVYNALERGVFRAAAFPYTYAFASYKLQEISKWYTNNLGPGANNCPTIVGIQAFEALPASYKELLLSGIPKGYAALKEAQKTTDAKNLADWRKRGLVEINYPPEELKKFSDMAAKPVWDTWVTEMSAKGVPARELLDLVVAEADKAKKALGK